MWKSLILKHSMWRSQEKKIPIQQSKADALIIYNNKLISLINSWPPYFFKPRKKMFKKILLIERKIEIQRNEPRSWSRLVTTAFFFFNSKTRRRCLIPEFAWISSFLSWVPTKLRVSGTAPIIMPQSGWLVLMALFLFLFGWQTKKKEAKASKFYQTPAKMRIENIWELSPTFTQKIDWT